MNTYKIQDALKGSQHSTHTAYPKLLTAIPITKLQV